MKAIWFVEALTGLVILGTICACSNGSPDVIDGTYDITVTVTASTCSGIAANETATGTMTVDHGGSNLRFAGITGTCSGGVADGDHVDWNCETDNGSLQVSGDFTQAGVTGEATVVGGDDENCSEQLSFAGSRQ